MRSKAVAVAQNKNTEILVVNSVLVLVLLIGNALRLMLF